MAEGFARSLKAGVVEAFSAGVEKRGLDPDAVRVMAEVGVDISGQRSKTVDDLPDVGFDHVVTLCGHAAENCPFFSGPAKRLHAGFDDPPALARDAPDEEARLAPYRRVRDEIRRFVAAMPGNLVGDDRP